MTLYLSLFLFIVGFILITKCGDLFVSGASFIAEATGIPKFIIGATIVSIATTLPEFLVSTYAVYRGSTALAIGNSLGSVICNTSMVLGVCLLFMGQKVDKKQFLGKSKLLILCLLSFFYFISDFELTMMESLFLILLLIFFFFINISESISNNRNAVKPYVSKGQWQYNIAIFLVGTAGVLVGAQLLVDNGVEIARTFQISEAIIGVSVIAIGTSLPELITTINAIAKKEAAMSVGNIIGANILNLVMILPTCSFLSAGRLMIQHRVLYMDAPVMMLAIGIAFIPPIITGKFYKAQGLILLFMYAIYLYKLI